MTVATIFKGREDFSSSVREFQETNSRLRVLSAPIRSDGWRGVCWYLRQIIGLVHFSDPRFDEMPRLRDRTRVRAPRRVLATIGSPLVRLRAFRWLYLVCARRLERAIPTDPAIDDFVRTLDPDVIVLSPLIDLDGDQWDYFSTARALGIPTVYPVYSWDNLSSKSLLHSLPDRILVWNEIQAREAARYHGVPADRIQVTGAQCFDDWLDRGPSVSREAFCEQLGLDPGKKLILYVASATTRQNMTEARFTRRWLRAVRGSPDERLREANVIIRPHPKRRDIWSKKDLKTSGGVIVHPGRGELPIGEAAQQRYYDSLYHCDLVVGLNTSALIEAGIIGRPVFTILDPDFAVDQVETFHFHYLLDAGQGLLAVAKSFDEHCDQICQALDQPERLVRRAADFVQSFIRPHSGERQAAPVFADRLVEAAKLSCSPQRANLLDRGLRSCLSHFVYDPALYYFRNNELKRFRKPRIPAATRLEAKRARYAVKNKVRDERKSRQRARTQHKAAAREAQIRAIEAHRLAKMRAKKARTFRRILRERLWRIRYLGALRPGSHQKTRSSDKE